MGEGGAIRPGGFCRFAIVNTVPEKKIFLVAYILWVTLCIRIFLYGLQKNFRWRCSLHSPLNLDDSRTKDHIPTRQLTLAWLKATVEELAAGGEDTKGCNVPSDIQGSKQLPTFSYTVEFQFADFFLQPAF